VGDIRRQLDIPGYRLAVRGTPLADGVFLASVLFADDRPVVSMVDDVVIIDVAGMAVPIRIDDPIMLAPAVERAVAQRLAFAARHWRLKIRGRPLDPAERIPVGASLSVETEGEVKQTLTLCQSDTPNRVVSRVFALGLTVAELVRILGGRMCVFYDRGLPTFEDPEQLVISYPLGVGPVHVQFIGQAAAAPPPQAIPLEAVPAPPFVPGTLDRAISNPGELPAALPPVMPPVMPPAVPPAVPPFRPVESDPVRCNLIFPPNDAIVEVELPRNATVADVVAHASAELGGRRCGVAGDGDDELLDGSMLVTELPEPRDLFVSETIAVEIRQRGARGGSYQEVRHTDTIGDLAARLEAHAPGCRYASVGGLVIAPDQQVQPVLFAVPKPSQGRIQVQSAGRDPEEVIVDLDAPAVALWREFSPDSGPPVDDRGPVRDDLTLRNVQGVLRA
jgi:hypothetical protein